MAAIDISRLAQPLVAAAHRAGVLIMEHYRNGGPVQRKADASPVTEADLASEGVILAALAELEPGIPVISEEAAAAGSVPETDDLFFLVDPLDGTKEFIAGRTEFTINIGLIRDGEPCFGLIYAPAIEALYVTPSEGRAAAATLPLDQTLPDWSSMEFSPMRTRMPPNDGLVAAVSRSHLDDATTRFLADHDVSSTLTSGSSLKFCVLAAGKADVYPRLGPTMEWDTAAGDAILRAAGGAVLAETGGPLPYGKRSSGHRNPGFIAWGRTPGPA